ERAVVLARGTEDVKDVRDQLSVVPAQAEVAANGSASPAPAAGAPSDAAITSTIETKLQSDQRVAGARIGVATNLGVVTLSGTVQSDQVKRDAMQIAQDTAGVQRVEDRLTVKSS
ncbi:MAG TPA: BON domain-containing protein, partial [Thermoanaerobaculia bacterium]|nr:BON domain-containing protein [Thermoanaerobaculia bacterium]